jgi:hypothetical protein
MAPSAADALLKAAEAADGRELTALHGRHVRRFAQLWRSEAAR